MNEPFIENRDNWSQHWSMYDRLLSENPAPVMRQSMIFSHIKGLKIKPDVLLDVGSGQGDFISKASTNNLANSYIGFELSEVGVELSRKKVLTASFYQIDLLNPPSDVAMLESSVDIAVCSEVLEHVDYPVEFLLNLKSFLKPGGKLILTVPSGPMSAFDRHLGHRTHYTRRSIASVLTQAGFKVEKLKMAGFPFFNLYRLLVVLRGSKVISDGESVGRASGKGMLMNIVMRIFSILFHFNLPSSPFGWQVVAIAAREN